MKVILICTVGLLILLGCKNETPKPFETDSDLYFPSLDGSEWETKSMDDLDWNTDKVSELENFLENNGTRAFIVLKDGRIIIEKYWGTNISNSNPFDQNSRWYWASAAKTISSLLIGIAQEEGKLNINNPSSDYLGDGWTSLSSEKERSITVENHLTMTTGLNFEVSDLNCTNPSCLQYKTDAGKQWFYHNAPYLLLKEIVSNATQTDFKTYTSDKLTSKIGMTGSWIGQDLDALFWSNARDMARFGLLILNKGKWNNESILRDQVFYANMTNSSQSLNPSYGYLWWLNGKNSIVFPSTTSSLNVSLSQNAPSDMIAAMGKNGQFIDVVPSQNLIIVRMGEAPDNFSVPISFHDEMWKKINDVITP